MKPSKLTVYELFQQSKRYVVPLYQRPYVWSREDQWEPLWEDIEAKAQAMLSGSMPRPHFLGAVVLNQVKAWMLQVASLQVIDGQQRLTTLQVFLAALRDVVAERGEQCNDQDRKQRLADVRTELEGLTRNRGVMNGPEQRFKVWPTNADREAFTAVLNAGSRTAVDAKYPVQFVGVRKLRALPGPRLVEAYRYFSDAVEAFFEEADSAAAPGHVSPEEALFGALKSALQLVVIELEDEDEPQVIFETLNARGAPLRPSDLIRNFVFTRAAGQQEDSDALYQELWASYDAKSEDGREGFWGQEVKVGRLKRPLLDLFFQHYLVCMSEHDVVLGHLYEEFRDWWNAAKPERSVRAGLAELKRFSETYSYFHAPAALAKADPRLALFLERMRVLDISTVYPFLLFILVETAGGLSHSERDDILESVESYLVRRWLCGLTGKNYNRLFASLVSDLRKAGKVSAAAVRERLLSGSKDARWPDDREFERVWLGEPLYERFDSAGIQMVLDAVHRRMLTAKQEKVQLLGELTVEHVMPQAWRAQWPAPPALRGADIEETAEERRDRLVHTLGNLTLLTHALNSTVSNGPYEAKRKEIVQNSFLALNTYFQAVEHWDEDSILARGRALLAHALVTWPYPAAAATSAGAA